MTDLSQVELEFAHRKMCAITFQQGYDAHKSGKPFWYPNGDPSITPALYASYKEGFEESLGRSLYDYEIMDNLY